MTIRGLLIAIAAEGLVLSACIGSPWLIVVPLRTAVIFVPQLIVVAICIYLATREWRAKRIALRVKSSSRRERSRETAMPEICYIDTVHGAVDHRGIVFESNSPSSADPRG